MSRTMPVDQCDAPSGLGVGDVDPRLVAVIETALQRALPYVDSYHLGDVAICVADDVWQWLAEGDGA